MTVTSEKNQFYSLSGGEALTSMHMISFHRLFIKKIATYTQKTHTLIYTYQIIVYTYLDIREYIDM